MHTKYVNKSQNIERQKPVSHLRLNFLQKQLTVAYFRKKLHIRCSVNHKKNSTRQRQTANHKVNLKQWKALETTLNTASSL